MRIAVAGGTGLVGSRTVAALGEAGHEAVVLARSRGTDLTTGAGLDAALVGVEAVIDVSNVATLRGSRATAFFEAAGGHLSAAAARAGVRHLVTLSIVGVDRVPLGYYRAKLRQEQLALRGPVPATVLRSAQFHEFAEQFLAGAAPVAWCRGCWCSRWRRPRWPRRWPGSRGAGPGPRPRPGRTAAGAARGHGAAPSRRPRDEATGGRALGAGARAAPRRGGALLPQHPGPRGQQSYAEWLTRDA